MKTTFENSQSSDINPASTQNTPNNVSQIQNSGFVQDSSVLAQNSQGSNPWGLPVNSQQGNNRGLTAEQIDNLNNNPPLLCFLHGTMGQMSGL